MRDVGRLSSLSSIAIFGVLLALIATACGSSGDDPGGPYTAENVCERLARQTCQALSPCCHSSGIGYESAGCLRVSLDECHAERAKIQTGKRAFDEAAVAPCVDAKLAMLQTCHGTYSDLFDTDGAIALCSRIFPGTVAEGGACQEDGDCTPSSDYKKKAVCKNAKCVVQVVRLDEGGDCHAGEGACGHGLFCDTSGTCKKTSAVGEACEYLTDCAFGDVCDAQTKKCAPGNAPGEPCSIHFDCASTMCEMGKCRAGFSLANRETCRGERSEYELDDQSEIQKRFSLALPAHRSRQP